MLQISGATNASAPVVVTFEAASYDASDMAFPVKGSCRRGDEIKVARPLVKSETGFRRVGGDC